MLSISASPRFPTRGSQLFLPLCIQILSMATKLSSVHRIISTNSFRKPSFACLHHNRSSPPRLFAHSFSSSAMSSNSSHTPAYRANGDNGDDANMHGELNQWKYRAPYKVHDNDPNFKVRYRASCHCGKIKYQLSREKPLDAKYCHCRTCQKLHGMTLSLFCPSALLSMLTF